MRALVVTKTIALTTEANMDVRDITKPVGEAVQTSGVTNGIVTVFIPGATGGITTIEFEPGLVQDLSEMFDRIVPPGIHYHHEERWHDGNGHSHIRASLLGPSVVIPFRDKRLLLGTWQQIIFVDFDVRRRERELIVQIMGE